jgi:hypothetical protein
LVRGQESVLIGVGPYGGPSFAESVADSASESSGSFECCTHWFRFTFETDRVVRSERI